MLAERWMWLSRNTMKYKLLLCSALILSNGLFGFANIAMEQFHRRRGRAEAGETPSHSSQTPMQRFVPSRSGGQSCVWNQI